MACHLRPYCWTLGPCGTAEGSLLGALQRLEGPVKIYQLSTELERRGVTNLLMTLTLFVRRHHPLRDVVAASLLLDEGAVQ